MNEYGGVTSSVVAAVDYDNQAAYTLMPDKENPNKGILIIAENQYSGSLSREADKIAKTLDTRRKTVLGTVEFLGDPNDRTQARENLAREAKIYPALTAGSRGSRDYNLRGDDGVGGLRRERGGNHLDHWRRALDAASPKSAEEGRKALGGVSAFSVVDSLHHSTIAAIDYNNMSQMLDYQLGRANTLLEGSLWELKGYNPNQPRGKSSAASNSGSFASTGGWPKNFPIAKPMTSGQKLTSHPDYEAAKAGDTDAANNVVFDVANQDKIAELGRLYPNAIIVPVLAQEAAGQNKLPVQFSELIGELTGNETVNHIVQTNKVHHTKAPAWWRFLKRAKFTGNVEAGRDYIIADDFVTMGGTISELRRYIEGQGGRVVAATTLAIAGSKHAGSSADLALSQGTMIALNEKFTNNGLHELLKEYGIYEGNPKSLTENEGRWLLTFSSLANLRKRLVKGEQEGRPIDSQRNRRAPNRSETKSDGRARIYACAQSGARGAEEEIDLPYQPSEKFLFDPFTYKQINDTGTNQIRQSETNSIQTCLAGGDESGRYVDATRNRGTQSGNERECPDWAAIIPREIGEREGRAKEETGVKSLAVSPITDTLIHYGGSIKTLEENGDCWRFGGWLVVFGSHDSSRFKDKFTAQTDFDIEDGERRGLYYNHGLDGTIKRTKLGDCRVYVKAAGVWIEGQIRKRTDYLKSHAEKIAANIESFGLSSGAPAHLVERKAVPGGHEILLWPLAEASITPTPAEPLTGCFSLKALVEAGDWGLEASVPGRCQSPASSLQSHSSGLRDGLAFDDHCARVLAAVGELQERVDGLAQMRCVKSGRRWSAGKFETLGTLADGLGEAAKQIRAVAEEHAPGGNADEVLQALARFEAVRARMNGVG